MADKIDQLKIDNVSYDIDLPPDATPSIASLTASGTIQGATIKKTNGTSSQFLKADGSVDSTTYLSSHQSIKSLNTNNASTLSVNSSEAIAGSGTISLNGISKTAQEEYLQWGGPSKSGTVSPIGMTLSNEHSANRMAFINGDLITAEYSSDGGSTWTEYSASATSKSQFFTQSYAFPVGRPTSATEVTADMSKTRITITAQNGSDPSGRVYTDPRKMLVLISSATALELVVEYRTGTNYKSGGAWSTFGTYTVSGWSGWSDIPLILGTLGGGSSQTGNNWQLRLTFTVKTKNSSYPKTADVLAVRIYGQNTWATPSTMAQTGHMYTFDMSKNVTFPAGVYAPTFYENGTALSNKYLGKTAKASDSDKLDGNDSSYYYPASNPNGYTSNIGTVTQVKVGTTAYDPSSGIVSLPAYPTKSSWNYDDTYLKLSGGTLTGALSITCSNVSVPLEIKSTGTTDSYVRIWNKDNSHSGYLGADTSGLLTMYESSQWRTLATRTWVENKGYTSVTESTVSGWGFTKNAGTVTSVDSTLPVNGNVALNAVSYVQQTLTDAQKTQARTNIGAGTSNFTGYTSSNKLSTDYINNVAGWTSNTGTVIGSGLTAEYFVVGNGTVNVKISSMRPSTSSTTWSTTSDVYVPTMKAISSYVTGLGYTSNTGTITGVSVNGTSVATSGVANITSVPWSIISSHEDVVELQSFNDANAGNGILIKGGNSGYGSGGTYLRHTSTSSSYNTLKLPSTNGTLATTDDIPSVSGFVTGPSSSTSTSIPKFSDTTGKVIAGSTLTVTDGNTSTATQLTTSGKGLYIGGNGNITLKSSGNGAVVEDSTFRPYANSSPYMSLGTSTYPWYNAYITNNVNIGNSDSSAGGSLSIVNNYGIAILSKVSASASVQLYHSGYSSYTLTFPTTTGTLALTSQLPTASYNSGLQISTGRSLYVPYATSSSNGVMRVTAGDGVGVSYSSGNVTITGTPIVDLR